MEQQDKRPLSDTEKKLKEAGIDARIELWLSIITESSLSDEAKQAISGVVKTFNEQRFNGLIDDWIYGCGHQLADKIEGFKDQDEASSVLKNIMDDMWAFWKEAREIMI